MTAAQYLTPKEYLRGTLLVKSSCEWATLSTSATIETTLSLISSTIILLKIENLVYKE